MTKKLSKIYFDYAATTPVDPRVLKTMLPYFSEKFGNTMSLYDLGQEAKAALEESREVVADSIKAKPNEIIFTGSATESNNLALKGIVFANKNRGKHIIISQIEHPCVMESARWLEKQGVDELRSSPSFRVAKAKVEKKKSSLTSPFANARVFEITRLKVDKYGQVNPDDVRKAIRKNTILVSSIHASNEIGTIQPIQEIGKICKEKGIYFHTDASQSFGKIPIDVNKMNVDLLTASSHKMYGPKGAGLLFVREGTKIEPILHGGGQESGLRSSTVNVPAIVGFAEACKIAKREMKKESRRLTKLRDKLIKGVLEKIPDSHLNGHHQKRLSNNANFWFESVEGESIVIQLDLMGVAASTGSACSSAKLEPSHVLLAIGLKPQQAHGSLRLSLGRWTKESDIDYLLKVLPEIIKKLRRISGK